MLESGICISSKHFYTSRTLSTIEHYKSSMIGLPRLGHSLAHHVSVKVVPKFLGRRGITLCRHHLSVQQLGLTGDIIVGVFDVGS